MLSDRLQDFIPGLRDHQEIRIGDTVTLFDPDASAFPGPFPAKIVSGGPQGVGVFLSLEAPYSEELHERLQANADTQGGCLNFYSEHRTPGGYTFSRNVGPSLTIVQRESGAAVQSLDGERLEFVVSVHP